MKRQLPITEKTRFSSYTYYSYLDAIVNNEYRTGSMCAKLKIDNYDEYVWKIEDRKLKMEREGEKIVFFASKYNIGMNAILYRELKASDEHILDILYQQYSQPWGSISVFVAEENYIQDTSKYDCKFGCFCNGQIFVKHKNKQIDFGNSGGEEVSFLMTHNEGNIKCIKKIEEKETVLFEYKCESEKKCYIGVEISLYDHDYYEWMFNNFFQIKLNKQKRSVMLEYDIAIKRDWRYFTTNHFLEYKVEKISTLIELGVCITHYIENSILNDSYIEVDIDSVDIVDSCCYKKEHMKHTCLIYGFDRKVQMFYLLCVDKFGEMVKSEITYDDLKRQTNEKGEKIISENSDLIVSEKFLPEQKACSFSKNIMIRNLRRYLEGKKAFDLTPAFASDDEYIYGIDVYKHLIDDTSIVIEDKRVSYLLMEHKKCMLDRIEYMSKKDVLDYDAFKYFYGEVNILLKKTQILHGYIIKNMISKNNNIDEIAIEYLHQIEKEENKFMKQLISYLEAR